MKSKKIQIGGTSKLYYEPDVNKIIPETNDSKDFSLLIQIKFFIILVECYLLNQVIALFNENKNNFINQINTDICKKISEATEMTNDSDKSITENNLIISSQYTNTLLPTEYMKYLNLVDNKALVILNCLSQKFKNDTIVTVSKTYKLSKKSIQYLINPQIITKYENIVQNELNDIGYITYDTIQNFSKLIYIFPQNSLIRQILTPLHEKASEIFNFKNIDSNGDIININKKLNFSSLIEEDDDEPMNNEKFQPENINFWHALNEDTIYYTIPAMIEEFSAKRVQKFANKIIPVLKEIYEKNPSLETALLLAQIGIPTLPYKQILDPEPNPELHQTDEEALQLKPLTDLLDGIYKHFSTLETSIFINRLNNNMKKVPELNNSLVKIFKINIISLNGNNLVLDVHSLMSVFELKTRIGYNISNEFYPEKIILIFSKYGEMDNERILGDYNIKEGSTINLVLSVKSGF